MQNPFTLVFGKNPVESIDRPTQINEIVETFSSEHLNQQVFMITGIRGSGKTVLMTQISNVFRNKENWVVLELNPEEDLLKDLASKLCSQNHLVSIFKNAKINLSFFGLGVEIDGISPITNIETAVESMLLSIAKQGKRILLTIDEATNTSQMRTFAAAFQIFVRKEIPVCLLMTGLYGNIRNLQDEKSLTFLYRSPRIELRGLNINAVSERYGKIFNLDNKEAKEMANMTMGYPFAFQTLGYITFKCSKKYSEVLSTYMQYLEEFSYDKIWSELSCKDKEIATAIAKTDSGNIQEIRETLNISTNEFNPYRKRLIQAGILNGDERGTVKFCLPLFKEFILNKY